jgi:GTPase involved in cell partitioning and DNA repair
MSNSNFVDYVKIFCRSGKGGSVAYISVGRSLYPREGPTGAMGDVAAISTLKEIASFGLYYT